MSKAPNIVLILSDDHGYGDISLHGAPHVRTPNIDRIAHEGMDLPHFYASSSVCSPSRAALMTGRCPDRVGVPGIIRTDDEWNWGYLRQDAVTMPDMLKRGGYHTAMAGKWHLGLEPENHPCRRGFDYFHGFLGDMMEDYFTHVRRGRNYMRENEREIDPEGHATDLFTQWACDIIRERAGGDRPFFLYLAYNAPHTPIQPPEEWYRRVAAREPDASEERARYVALIEHMDDGIGKVLDALDAAGCAEDTLVIYTSDNGGDLAVGAWNGPVRGGKFDAYEGGIRVPGCVRWPARIAEGSAHGGVAMLLDLLPTFCEMAGVPVDHEIEGRSMLPALTGDARDDPDRILYWVRREGMDFAGLCQHAVRVGDLKLLHNGPFEPLELFRLDDDPLEENDRAAREPEEFARMRDILRVEIKKAGGVPWQKT